MGYYLKSALGVALSIGSLVLFNVELIALLETGTCASGNTPYVIARPCPEGTGTDTLLLVVSIFAGLIGTLIYTFRGASPRGGDSQRSVRRFGHPIVAWGVFFTATGAVSLYHSLSSEAVGADGELGGAIVGGTFLLMGLPVMAFVVWALISDLGGGREGPADGSDRGYPPIRTGFSAPMPAPTPPPAPAADPADDTLERVERLQRLRESGALTATEFELQKARILNG